MSKQTTTRRMATGRIPAKRIRAILAREGKTRDDIAAAVRRLGR